MNIFLGIIIAIVSVIVLNLIGQMLNMVRQYIALRTHEIKNDRLDVLAGICAGASEYYWRAVTETNIALKDYAYLAEVSLYNLVIELGGDPLFISKLTKINTKLKPLTKYDLSKRFGDNAQNKTPANGKPNQQPKKEDTRSNKDKEIDALLDMWEAKHPGWRNKGKKKDDNRNK